MKSAMCLTCETRAQKYVWKNRTVVYRVAKKKLKKDKTLHKQYGGVHKCTYKIGTIDLVRHNWVSVYIVYPICRKELYILFADKLKTLKVNSHLKKNWTIYVKLWSIKHANAVTFLIYIRRSFLELILCKLKCKSSVIWKRTIQLYLTTLQILIVFIHFTLRIWKFMRSRIGNQNQMYGNTR